MPDEVADFVEVEIEAEPVFADCLKLKFNTSNRELIDLMG